MINLLLGPPGGGKSYEACVYHILKALQKGRKVITNLPVNVDRFHAIVPGSEGLLELRQKSKAPGCRVFAHEDDYGDPWRHPDTGAGPLYVVDECHLAMPRGGTRVEVEEWYSLHRHESADVLLITQSYGKVSKSICDLVQVVYRVRKAVAFGFSSKYVRKVQDGLRGEVISTEFRTYEKRYFGLYVSHTRGGGSELAAQDVKSIWRNWYFIAAPVLLIGGCVGLGTNTIGLFDNVVKKPAAPPVAKVVQVDQKAPPVVLRPSVEAPVPAEASTTAKAPFDSLKVHVQGFAQMGDRWRYSLILSSSGVPIQRVEHRELESAGYTVRRISECAMGYTWPGSSEQIAVCDQPTQLFGIVAGV